MKEEHERLADGVDLVVRTHPSGQRTRELWMHLTLRVALEDMRKITGLTSEREIAAWLAEQRPHLEENATIAAVEGVTMPNGDLAHYAACDRDDGKLPPSEWRCTCGEHERR